MSATTPDLTLAALAAYACRPPLALDNEQAIACQRVITDTLAVSLGALTHPAAVAARRYARLAQVPSGATLWGSGERVMAEAAALANGVPLRAYDFNDLYIGKGCGGHPSDIIPGLFALAEQQASSGAQLLDAIVVGYEVTIALMDTIPLKRHGWDYPNVSAIGAVCGAVRLLGLTEAQAREALAITVIPHFSSLEIESGELNACGDLTMWKRFNGSDAVRHALYAAALAKAGVEGAVRPFEGAAGFLQKTGTDAQQRAQLLERLDPRGLVKGITRPVLKRWPVGSRAQSAIQAALEARSQIDSTDAIREVRVRADLGVYEHLVSSRSAPWEPNSRETADHSLPYIVAAAVLDGQVSVDTFAPQRVCEPKLQAFLPKVKVIPDPALPQGAAAGFLAGVEITMASGQGVTGAAKPPPGHSLNPIGDEELNAKFMTSVAASFGPEQAGEILRAVKRLAAADSVAPLARLLVAPGLAAQEAA